jgi:hypothetical protein
MKLLQAGDATNATAIATNATAISDGATARTAGITNALQFQMRLQGTAGDAMKPLPLFQMKRSNRYNK